MVMLLCWRILSCDLVYGGPSAQLPSILHLPSPAVRRPDHQEGNGPGKKRVATVYILGALDLLSISSAFLRAQVSGMECMQNNPASLHSS